MSLKDRFLLAGVMGWPVMHSRSPLIHNHWLAHHGLAGRYVPLAIRPEGLTAAMRALPALGFSGCNVTIPHKQQALTIVDEVHETARAMGAISCVTVRPDGSLLGGNNDAYGFIRNLHRQQPLWRPDAGPAVVVGAGGGARAVCYGLLQEGVREIRLVNRTRARAEQVALALGAGITVWDWAERNTALESAALLVNATSQGMVGQGALELSLDRLPRSATVADIIYIPLPTPLLAAARARGHDTVDGLGMLLQQGPLAWKAWFGIEPEVTPELRALVEASLQHLA
jgi:shikimate dehydrogenase